MGVNGHITYTNVSDETPVFNNNTPLTNSWSDEGGGIYSKSSIAAVIGFIENYLPLPSGTSTLLSPGTWYWVILEHLNYITDQHR